MRCHSSGYQAYSLALLPEPCSATEEQSGIYAKCHGK